MQITKPTLLVDKGKCMVNIQKMVTKAKNSQAVLRPHFKTHHSAAIADWYRSAGVEKCTVSSVSMASYFAEHGWNDITIAFPYNPLEIQEINKLASYNQLNVLIESIESLEHAKTHLTNSVGYFLKIDVGTHRTGLDHRSEDTIAKLIEGSSEHLEFKGFLAHAGHTYGSKNRENLEYIFNGAKKILLPLREKFGGIISFGDTPSCSIMDDLSDFDELRPGNFVFYDWMQHEIGSCQFEEIAVCLAAPVVALHPERNEVVVYGGAVHLSKDRVGGNGETSFGKVVSLTKSGWENKVLGNVVRLSQEHGIIQLPKEKLSQINVGDLIGIIPVHSCLAADLQGHYLSTNGDRIDKIIKN